MSIMDDYACGFKTEVQPPTFSQPMTMKALASEVCAKHQITLDDLKGASHKRCFAWPRQEFMARAYDELPRTTFPGIGRFLGRDHSTVVFGRAAYLKRGAANDN